MVLTKVLYFVNIYIMNSKMSDAEKAERLVLNAESFRGLSKYTTPEERRFIDQALARPGELITLDFLSDHGYLSELDGEQHEAVMRLADTVGLPETGENVETYTLSPNELVNQIRASKGSLAGYPHNNQYALFAYDGGKGLGQGIDDFRPGPLKSAICPPYIRFKALFPGLAEGMIEYGKQHRSLHEFYNGLVGTNPKSNQARMLFIVSDQLLQRLTRPGDAQYEMACFNAALDGKGKDYTPPKYNEINFGAADQPIVTNAHDFLYQWLATELQKINSHARVVKLW